MKNKRNYLPLTLDITDQRILVIGGGDDAAKKVKILQRFTGNIDVLCQHPSQAMIDTGVVIRKESYKPHIILSYALVYVSTSDHALEERVVDDGRLLRVLVNVHDKPDKCRFISPAVFQHNEYTVAVGSNGRNVMEAINIRNKVGDFLLGNYFQN